jgi:SCY1-like protein 1
VSSVFVDLSGEWKLSGVEFMYSFADGNPPVKNLEQLKKYSPPESTKGTRKVEKWSTDMWGLGCLIWEMFNGPLAQSSNLKNTSKLPKNLVSHYCELVSANPMSRPNPSTLLAALKAPNGYLSNPFISLALNIEELQLMDAEKKNNFFTEFKKSLQMFPDSYARYKILPHLLNAFEFGGAGPSILGPLLKIGKLLPDNEYQRKIVPCIVRSFASNDRATRFNLLQQLDQFIDQLQPTVINDQLFPHIITGFTDTAPAIREQTIKAALLLTPKLNDNNLNNQLLKCFAKCQMDEQPGIRTNTTICLGKIASHLNSKTRDKVLISALTRSLKDPFSPARSAGIGALAETISYYSAQDTATRILPALCHMTVDQEKSVRDQTFKVIKLFMEKLEKHSEGIISSPEEQEVNSISEQSI